MHFPNPPRSLTPPPCPLHSAGFGVACKERSCSTYSCQKQARPQSGAAGRGWPGPPTEGCRVASWRRCKAAGGPVTFGLGGRSGLWRLVLSPASHVKLCAARISPAASLLATLLAAPRHAAASGRAPLPCTCCCLPGAPISSRGSKGHTARARACLPTAKATCQLGPPPSPPCSA